MCVYIYIYNIYYLYIKIYTIQSRHVILYKSTGVFFKIDRFGSQWDSAKKEKKLLHVIVKFNDVCQKKKLLHMKFILLLLDI